MECATQAVSEIGNAVMDSFPVNMEFAKYIFNKYLTFNIMSDMALKIPFWLWKDDYENENIKRYFKD